MNYNITQFFEYNLDRNKLLDQLKKLGKKSLVVFWYVGMNGLKTDSVRYYQKLFRMILASNPDTKIMLYDLTAWKALFDVNYSISDFNDQIGNVEELSSRRITAFKSSDFFNWLINQTNDQMKSFLDILFADERLYVASQIYPNSKIKFSDLNFVNYPVILFFIEIRVKAIRVYNI